MGDVHLIVGGTKYGGWKGVRVTRSIESISGSFDLDVTDRWTDFEAYIPIQREDACRVEVAGETVIDGYIEKRGISISASMRSLSFSGRDKAAALVDSSVLIERWSFRNASVLHLAAAVCDPLGIRVSVQPGLVLPKAPAKTVINPGDTGFQVIERAAQAAGVLVVSDGAGGLVITRAGAARATSLIEGQNIKEASVDYDGTSRFARYIVGTQIAGTDRASGIATRIQGEATDQGVRRPERVLLIRPEAGVTADYARRRADWEARIRAAKAGTVSVTVCGWQQPSGALWPVNALVSIRSPSLGLDGDLLISQVEYSIDDGGGEVTKLSLVRPDAFTPEPTPTVRTGGSGAWKELATGAL